MFVNLTFVVMFLATASAFLSRGLNTGRVQFTRQFADKIKITDGVEFDTIAREWRLKWSPDDDKKSLAAVQQSLQVFLPAIKKIDGVQSVQRIVCGGCLDYKVKRILLCAEESDPLFSDSRSFCLLNVSRNFAGYHRSAS